MTEDEALKIVFELAERSLDKSSPDYASHSEALAAVDELISKMGKSKFDLSPLEHIRQQVSA